MPVRHSEGIPNRQRGRGHGGLSQFGLLDVPGIDALGNIEGFAGGEDDDQDDADNAALEAELLALTSGQPTAIRRSPRPKVRGNVSNLDQMVATCMKDVDSDEELSGDEDQLMAELAALSPGEAADELQKPSRLPTQMQSPSPETAARPLRSGPIPAAAPSAHSVVDLLEERIEMYKQAEQNARVTGESSRARRFQRGLKTLTSQLKAVKSGRPISEEDIPPPVVISTSKSSSAAVTPSSESVSSPESESSGSSATRLPNAHGVAPPPPSSQREVPPPAPQSEAPPVPAPRQQTQGPEVTVHQETMPANSVINILQKRKDEYKHAAVAAKKAGNLEMAKEYVKTFKQFEVVLAAAQQGQPVDLTQMPPPPMLTPVATRPAPPPPTTHPVESSGGAAAGQTTDQTVSSDAPPVPTTILEALEQRRAKYASVGDQAKEEGNNSKVRRMGRIVKQYDDAIRLHKAGKPVPVDELPTPPGFPPIPTKQEAVPPAVPPPSTNKPDEPPEQLKPKTEVTPPNKGLQADAPKRASVRTSPQALQEKQLTFLIQRQKQFKVAAANALKNNERKQAKEYLKISKQFDPLIEASRGGLPVDLNTVPVPPQLQKQMSFDMVQKENFEIVNKDDCIPAGSEGATLELGNTTDSSEDMYKRLQEDLLKQVKICIQNRDHCRAIGDVANANKFEQLGQYCHKDLDALRNGHRRGESLPKFHYENRQFTIVQSCTELTDSDIEITVLRGVNYNVSNPKTVDTYVKFEFPFPSESPQSDRTAVIKDTNNPEYNHTTMFSINRSARALARVFKRHSLKCEIFSKGGFFRSDTLIGTVNAKLQLLESKCTLHDSFPLMDGRRAVGGKLEIRIRLRNPIVTKQVTQVTEKWLVVDCW